MKIDFVDERSTCRQGPTALRFPLSTYHGGDIYNNSVDIDFSVNLNPYVTDELKAVIKEAASEGMASASFYPDPDQKAVRSALADMENIDMECVFAGNGASELLLASARMLNPGKALLIEPCYTGYEYALKCVRDCGIRRYSLREEEGFCLTKDVLDAITDDIDVICLADPNNPTGKNIDGNLLEKILGRSDELNISVVLDRSFYMLSNAYNKNTDEKYAELISKYKNLFIIKSFTKCFALPGIRMGYVISSSDNVLKLSRHLPEWNLPSVSDALMRRLSVYAKDGKFYRDSIEQIKTERSFLMKELSGTGFKVFESDTNYLLIKSHKNIYEKLLDKGILIRKCDDFYGLNGDFYRIAVKGREDNIHLIEALAGM